MCIRILLKRAGLVFLGIVFAVFVLEIGSGVIGALGGAKPLGALYFLGNKKPLSTYSYEIPAHIKNYPRFPDKGTGGFYGGLGEVHYSETDGELFFGRKSSQENIIFFPDVLPQAATVTIDEHRHRITNSSNTASRKKHLLFMGCSMVFGDGLTDADTFPWKIHHLQNEYDVFNLGFSAYNPALTYRMLERYQWLDGVPVTPGRAFFILYPFHIERFKALTAHLDPSGYPYYNVEADGQMEFIGAGASLSGVKGALQSLYMKTQFYKTFRWSWPWITSYDYKSMSYVLKKIELKYLEKFGRDSQFYVVLAPYNYREEEQVALKNSLEAAHVSFMDFSTHNLSEYVDGPAKLPDGHMNSEATTLFADMFWNEIQFLDLKK